MKHLVEKLQAGEEVTTKLHGSSMKGFIENGDIVTIIPADVSQVLIGQAVLCKVKGRIYCHKVLKREKDQVLIANNRNHVNGWTSQVYGVVSKIEKPKN